MKKIHQKDNLISLLQQRSDFCENQVLYRFVQSDDASAQKLTAGALEARAMSIALELNRCCKKGDRALLMYNSGLEFIAAFFGCLYAQVIAVPVYPPRKNQKINRLQAIIADAGVQVVLSTGSIEKQARSVQDQSLLKSTWIDTESLSPEIDKTAFQYPSINAEDVMFLQYTSGSTGNPKGVAVTHKNMMANESMIFEAFEHEKNGHYVSWLPYFHDMGLIGAILQSLYADIPLTLMNPAFFLRKPVRWLRAISDNKATVSGGPNFAYDLCVDNIRDEDLEGIDLSSWKVAFNGAEPVSARTLNRFAERFEKYGFRRSAFFPCFGLAEATLFVNGNLNSNGPRFLNVDKTALQQGKIVEEQNEAQATEIVSCGHTWQNHQVEIVNPETKLRCAENEVGELWFKGDSVANGYWKNPEKTKEVFEAYMKDTNDGPFLRTGDLAFAKNDEVYITGRLKDMLIIRGRNYYPQDLEFVCSQSHESLVDNSTAAFSVETDEGEQLVIVQEVKRTAVRSINAEEVFESIVSNVSLEYQVSVHDVLLLIPGRILKTSSGKIQRQANKGAYLSAGFEPIAQWRSEEDITKAEEEIQSLEKNALAQRALQDWMKSKIGELVKTPAHRIQVHKDFNAFGLDSVSAIKLSNELSTHLNKDVPPNLIYDYPSIALLSGHLLGLNKTQTGTVKSDDKLNNHEVAIVGMSCRFPGARNVAEFEKLLFEEINAISTPGETLMMDHDPREISYRSGYLEEVDQFDAGFFEISPKEAKAIDPQQRLLLELSYETLQNAGYASENLKGSDTGVFIGVSNFDYAELTFKNGQHKSAYFGTGVALSTTANRLSYYYDFKGPSIAVDTACSSSLVAVHQAVRSIRTGESTMALAGGVNLILSDNVNQYLDAGTLLASDGHCKTFDAAADGYVRGEGVGMILLKSKEQALLDGDTILAVIKGSAVAQDGHSNGILAPNGLSQQKVIREALSDAGVSPPDIGYVESHGTGTSLGDPIEVAALDEVYGKERNRETALLVGAVKANIGHLESAAGIAGLIKSVICLNRQQVPKQLHFKQPNPNISWEKTAVKIPEAISPLIEKDKPLRAGVSSFGFGGTIAHLILEASEQVQKNSAQVERAPSGVPQLILISAKSKEAERAQWQKFKDYLQGQPDSDLASIAYSQSVSRDHFAHRLAIKCARPTDLDKSLDGIISTQDCTAAFRPQRDNYQGRKAFLFTGGGSQYVGMADDLYRDQPVFKSALDDCIELSKEWLEVNLRDILFAEANSNEETLLNRIDYMQPALFAFEYATSQLWKSWGVEPDVLIGHSLGEIVAACVAGIFSLKDGLKLICSRGKLMQSLPAGGVMISIQADENEVEQIIGADKDAVSIAVINGPTQTVISGEKDKAEKVRLVFEAKGVKTKVLQVSHASHSVLMNPILEAYGKVVESITFHKPQYKLISNVVDKEGKAAIDTAAYWISHLRDTVYFAAGVCELESLGIDVWIEVGPQPVLLGIAGNCHSGGESVSWLPSAREGEESTIYDSVAQLYAEGGTFNWEAYYDSQAVKKVSLPTYEFQRESYWINTSTLSSRAGETHSGNPLLGYEVKIAGESRIYESMISLAHLPFLNDHRVFDNALMPGAAFCELIQGYIQNQTEALFLDEIVFENPLWLSQGTEYRLQLVVNTSEEDGDKFQVFSSPVSGEEKWQSHARGTLGDKSEKNAVSLDKPPKVINGGLNIREFYDSFALKGMEYGASFQPIKEIYKKNQSALGKLSLLGAIDADQSQGYQLHPILLDGAFQLLGVLFDNTDKACLPFSVEGYELLAPGTTEIWVEATILENESTGDIKCASIRLWNDEGTALGAIDKLYVKEVSEAILSSEVKTDWLYDLVWKPLSLETNQLDIKGQKWLILHSDNQAEYVGQLITGITDSGGKVLDVNTWQKAKDKFEGVDKIINIWPSNSGQDMAGQAETNALNGLNQLKDLLQAQSAGELDNLKDIWWITEDKDADPSLAPLWGLGRVFMQEHIDLPLRLLEINFDQPEVDKPDTLLPLLASDDENQVRISEKGIECLRLIKREEAGSPDTTTNSRLSITEEGVLDSLQLLPTTRGHLLDHEVEIAVSHAGLNFRDIFKALNLISTDMGELGGECSGVIVKVGKGVRNFKEGDEVIALAEGSFSGYTTTDHRLVAHKPKELSFEEAATIPITFVTAWYGLKTVANLTEGERILIHSAAGGVGMAAIQIANHLKAEVYGTASQLKQGAVRQMGVNQIYDSRTFLFNEQIKKDTDGQGVDVVLNSFTKEFIDLSLDLLSDKGRFLEIGKRDIRTEESIHAVHPDISYTPYDLIYLMKNEQGLISKIFEELMPLFEDKTFKPLPATAFSMDRAQEAFKFMSQARHTGKVVLVNPEQEEPLEFSLAPDSTVLLTGGLGGLGLEVANQLVKRYQIKHLVLLGRKVPSERAVETIAELEALGTKVSVYSVDVTDKAAMSEVISAASNIYPLRGVIHLAGILEDALIVNQDESLFKRAMAPKVKGAWNLHELTSHLDLDLFVLFSSAASVMGSVSQSNYASGNVFLDSLAAFRRKQGFVAHSINWGPWSSVGLVHALGQEHKKRIQKQGLGLISIEQGIGLMDHLIQRQGENAVVLSLNTARFGAALSVVSKSIPPIYRDLVHQRELQNTKEDSAELIKRLSVLEPDKGKKELEGILQKVIAQILSVSDVRKVHLDKSLQEFGMDSLMAVELRNKLSAMFGKKLSVTLLFDYPNIKALAGYLWEDIIPQEIQEPEGADKESLDWKQAVYQQLMSRLQAIDKNGQIDYAKSIEGMMNELERMMDKSVQGEEKEDEDFLDNLSLEELEDEFEKELKDL